MACRASQSRGACSWFLFGGAPGAHGRHQPSQITPCTTAIIRRSIARAALLAACFFCCDRRAGGAQQQQSSRHFSVHRCMAGSTRTPRACVRNPPAVSKWIREVQCSCATRPYLSKDVEGPKFNADKLLTCASSDPTRASARCASPSLVC